MRMIKMAITASVMLFATSGFAAWKKLPCGTMVQTNINNTSGSYTKADKLMAKAKTTSLPGSDIDGQQ